MKPFAPHYPSVEGYTWPIAVKLLEREHLVPAFIEGLPTAQARNRVFPHLVAAVAKAFAHSLEDRLGNFVIRQEGALLLKHGGDRYRQLYNSRIRAQFRSDIASRESDECPSKKMRDRSERASMALTQAKLEVAQLEAAIRQSPAYQVDWKQSIPMECALRERLLDYSGFPRVGKRDPRWWASIVLRFAATAAYDSETVPHKIFLRDFSTLNTIKECVLTNRVLWDAACGDIFNSRTDECALPKRIIDEGTIRRMRQTLRKDDLAMIRWFAKYRTRSIEYLTWISEDKKISCDRFSAWGIKYIDTGWLDELLAAASSAADTSVSPEHPELLACLSDETPTLSIYHTFMRMGMTVRRVKGMPRKNSMATL